MNTMPPAIVAPAWPMLPPFAATPLILSNSRFVLYVQSIWPSLVERARSFPSDEPVNPTPGSADIAAGFPPPVAASFAVHGRDPSDSLIAATPPPGWFNP